MLLWRFYINEILVEEPIGWDAAEFTLLRSDQYTGLENLYTDSFTFDGAGATILKTIYDNEGIDGNAVLKVQYNCDNAWVDYFTGIVNLFTYKYENGEVTVQFEDSGFNRKFKNRVDIPVNFQSLKSIGNVDITAADTFDLGLHSKTIVKEAEAIANTALFPFSDSYTFNFGTTFNRVELPFQISINEAKQLNEATSVFFFNAPGLSTSSGVPIFTISESGDSLTVTYRIKGSLTNVCADSTSFQFNLLYAHGNNATENQTILYQIPASGGLIYPAGSHTINFDVSGSFDFVPVSGKSVYFLITINEYRNLNASSPHPSTITLDLDSTSKINIKEYTTSEPSTAKAIKLLDCWKQVSKAVVDEEDSFSSDFFSIDCGKYFAITNGKLIRKMKTKDGLDFPVVMSFQDLYDACNAIWNIGLRIETDSLGKKRIRVEPKEFFYTSNSTIQLDNVNNLQTIPATDLIFNEFEVGYEKSTLNVSGVNGFDEFNSKHNYSLPLEKAKKKLLAICKFITSGYLIEQTRRIQYSSNPNTDFETDDNNFIIATNPTEVASDKYTAPPVSMIYAPGTVSERDENFTSVNNLISPETSYNLRLSPVRMAINWYTYLKASLSKKINPVIKFISGTLNYQEGDTLNDGCDLASGAVTQNMDLDDTKVLDGTALYVPNYLLLDYPLTFSQFQALSQNTIDTIEVSCSDGNFIRATIKELKIFPNGEGWIANFKLIEGACTMGAFDEGFSNGFDIGSC